MGDESRPLNRPTTGPIDRRESLAVALSGLDGAVVGSLLFVGTTGSPGWVMVWVFQALLVPVGPAAGYVTARGRPRIVPLLAVVPALAAVVVMMGVYTGTWLEAPIGELVRGAGLVAVVVFAFSGSWAVVGYAAGTAWLWGHRAAIPPRHVLVRCLWVLVGAAAVVGPYWVAVGLALGLGNY